MTRKSLSHLLYLVLASAITCVSAGTLVGQTPLVDASEFESDPAYGIWAGDSEVRKCGLCHFSAGNAFAQRDTDFCQLNEVEVWIRNDLHSVSRQRIEPLTSEQLQHFRQAAGLVPSAASWFSESNVLSHSICQSLGYDLTTEEGSSSFRDNCLTCHAGYDATAPTTEHSMPGISCNYCHQTGEHKDWIDQHGSISAKETWRLLSPVAKSKLGMRDLINERMKGELCADCHIGSHAKGMFVSHAMYAAGHPPLPAFELQTFVASMPRHWRNERETHEGLANFPSRETYFQLNYSSRDPSRELARTRALLIGAITSAKQSAQLIAEADQRWADYANYDCSACHHELKVSSPRQRRSLDGAPGRPRLREWTTPLLDVAVRYANTAERVGKAEKSLREAIAATPFGEPKRCQDLAAALVDELDQSLASEHLVSIPIEDANAILRLLLGTPEQNLLDYQAARQLVWAIQAVDQDLADVGQPLESSLRVGIANLGLHASEVLIATTLPAGRENRVTIPDNFLEEELNRIRSYDVAALTSKLLALRSELR